MSNYFIEFKCVSGDFHLSGDEIVYQLSLKICDEDSSLSIDKFICRIIGQYKYNQNEIKQKMSLAEFRKSSIAYKAPTSDKDSLIQKIDKTYNDDSNTHLDLTLKKLEFLEDVKGFKCVRIYSKLPEFIPPNFRGSYFRVAYKTILAIRFVISRSIYSKVFEEVLQIPLRVYPSTKSYIWPSSLVFNYENTISESCFTSISLNPYATSNPFKDVEIEDEDLDSVPNFFQPKTLPGAHVIPSNFNVNSEVSKNPHNKNSSCNNKYNSSILVELANSSSQSNYFISNSKGRVLRVSLSKTTHLVGNEIRGFLDFTASQIPCLICTISLKSCESLIRSESSSNTISFEENTIAIQRPPLSLVNEEQISTFINVKKPDSDAHWTQVASQRIDGCLSHKLFPFCIQIPFTVQPQFSVKSNHFGTDKINLFHSFNWYLHIEFIVASVVPVYHTRTIDKVIKSECLKFPLVDAQGKNIPLETLEWTLPIRLFPPTYSNAHFPPEDSKFSRNVSYEL